MWNIVRKCSESEASPRMYKRHHLALQLRYEYLAPCTFINCNILFPVFMPIGTYLRTLWFCVSEASLSRLLWRLYIIGRNRFYISNMYVV